MRAKVKNYILICAVIFPFVFGMFLIDPAHDRPAVLAGYWLAYLAWIVLFIYANFFHKDKEEVEEEPKEKEFQWIDMKCSND